MIRIAFCQTNRLFILLERAETEIGFSLGNDMFKMKMDINRHDPRPMPNNCKNLNPPNFSLPTTFNSVQCFTDPRDFLLLYIKRTRALVRASKVQSFEKKRPVSILSQGIVKKAMQKYRFFIKKSFKNKRKGFLPQVWI